MAMANLNRTVAEALMRAYQADWGPAGSDPNLKSTVTSETLYEQLMEQGFPVGHDTVMSILRDLADQDYIRLAPRTEDDPVTPSGALTVQKVYPARLKRDFNLWHVAEEYEEF
jgi:hypothetical protein